MEEKYEKIVGMAHHVSPVRRKMEIKDRAAQFAPYAALVGFGDVVEETARTTEERIVPDEQTAEKINRTLSYLVASNYTAKAEFRFFVKDERKAGGHHATKIGAVKAVDGIMRTVKFTDGFTLSIDDLIDINLI